MSMRSKKISTYTVELDGGKIAVLKTPTDEERAGARLLPHIFTVREDGLYVVGEVPFLYKENALASYREIKRVADILDLLSAYYL